VVAECVAKSNVALEKNHTKKSECHGEVSCPDIRREGNYEQPEDQRRAMIQAPPEKVANPCAVLPSESELTQRLDAPRAVYGHCKK